MLSTQIPVPSYGVGDVPAAPLVLEIEADMEPADLTGFTGVDVALVNAWGEEVEGLTAVIDGDSVEVSWPSTTPFERVGVYQLALAFTAPTARESLAPVRFVVQAVNGWHTLESARAQWKDAPGMDDALLWEILDSAHTACVEFAPAIDPLKPIPLNYRRAQLLQAQAIWQAGTANTGDEVGFDGQTVRVYPLDWNVKQLLRPRRAVPVIV